MMDGRTNWRTDGVVGWPLPQLEEKKRRSFVSRQFIFKMYNFLHERKKRRSLPTRRRRRLYDYSRKTLVNEVNSERKSNQAERQSTKFTVVVVAGGSSSANNYGENLIVNLKRNSWTISLNYQKSNNYYVFKWSSEGHGGWWCGIKYNHTLQSPPPPSRIELPEMRFM